MSGITLVSVLAFGGNAAIYIGFAFINAKLFPGLFDVFYKSSSPSVRTVIMVVLFAVPADYVFALCFRMAQPSIAAMAILATLVVVMIANTLIFEGALSARAWVAACFTIVAAGWFAYEQGIGSG